MQNIVDFTFDGHTSRYLHLPQANKPALIFLMGSLQEIESVQAFNRGFSQDFDYWAIELPGSGNTGPLHPRFPVSFLAEYLNKMVESLLANRAVYLVACSYATGIALEYAKLRPSGLRRMALAGSMMDIPLSDWPTMLQLMRDCAFDTRAFADGFIDLLTAPDVNIERQSVIRKAAVRKAANYRDENFWHFVFNTIRLMCYEPKNLQKIVTPTLVFTGEHDPYVRPEHCERLAGSLKHGEFCVLPGCDHLFHIEKPRETIDLILNFLKQESEELAA